MELLAVLLADEPFKVSEHYRNTLCLPNVKAFARADGIKPENIAEMLSLDGCDKVIIFPYFPLDGKSAYYELALGVEKDSFVDFLNRVAERRSNEMYEAIMQADRRSKAGYRAMLRMEKKSDWKTVEQVTYRAFRDLHDLGVIPISQGMTLKSCEPPTGSGDDGNEALLARKLRSRPAFVPELDYVAELNGSIIGNIMYMRISI